MKTLSPKKAELLKVPKERTNLLFNLAKNANYFGSLPKSELEAVLKQQSNTNYEEITCVGYNPYTRLMEATFEIKRANGYSGGLCSTGSFEYIRFYLDFHDGAGFIDQGVAAVNVHNIPEMEDCSGASSLPLSYSVTKEKETNRFSFCKSPLLPTLRAILSWGVEPPADMPDWTPPWGNVKECDVQFRPNIFIPELPIKPEILDFFEFAVTHPDLPIKELAEVSNVDLDAVKPKPSVLSIDLLAKKYAKEKVSPTRFAMKAAHQLIQEPLSSTSKLQVEKFSKLDIDLSKIIDDLSVLVPVDNSKANVDYEELGCIGFDYHKEALVATIAIKRDAGYSGDLCDDGSMEYVAFWIDWDDDCNWEYLDTVELNVHDIEIRGDQLCYSVTLPLDTKFHRKPCTKPNVVRIRGVLSWNIPPSTTDPNALNYYGNRLDAHIQIKPGPVLEPGEIIPLFNIIGGIDVAHVSNLTGLTTPGAFFALNGIPVPTGAPFGGVIVLNGPNFPGYRYRIKVTNLNTGTFEYIDNNFTVVGYLPVFPWVQYTTQSVDAAGFYPFLPDSKNTLNVLARFSPGTQDRFQVEMEVDTVAGTFSKIIQMDNKKPDIAIEVDDGGDCTKYSKGDTITGHFYVNDPFIRSWSFGSTWGGAQAGTTNTPALPGAPFSIPTGANAHPCGRLTLYARDKAIVNSQSVGHDISTGYNICLQE